MTTQFYLVPVHTVNDTNRGPSYLKWRLNPAGLDVPWSAKDYGLIDTMLVAADVTTDQHNTLTANADVTAIPANIDQPISQAALPTVKNHLEALHIPAKWVTTAHTYRDVLRLTAHLFMLAQRLHGLYGQKIIRAGYNLNTPIGDLPATVRQQLVATAHSFGWDTSAIQLSWQLRQALRYLATQWKDAPVIFGNLTTL